MVLSVALVLALLLLISLDNILQRPADESVTIREIELAAPPPPAPPPQVVSPSQSAEPRLNLSLAVADAPVELMTMALDIDVVAGALVGQGEGNWGEGIGIDWGGFSISELDAVPMVISAPLTKYPDALLEEGIESFVVHLHILIDETGRTYLIGILDNPYAPFNDNIKEFVPGVRFTPPTLGGKIVKAEFSWPVKFGTP